MRVWICLAACLVLFCGCRTARTIDGRACYPLSEKQRKLVVGVARDSLTTGSAKVKFTTAELERIWKEDPIFRIRYTGDYAGEMSCKWELDAKTVLVEARGQFDDMDDPSAFDWRMSIQYHENEYVYQNVPGRRNTIAKPPLEHPEKRRTRIVSDEETRKRAK